MALRFAIAGALLLALGRLLKIEPQHGGRLYRLWAIVTLFSFCLSYGIVYWAEQWISSGLTSVLFATFPLFVAVLAHLWLPAEPLDGWQLLGLGVGLAGVLTLFSDDLALTGERSALAAFVMLGSPLGAAVSHVLVKKWGSGIHPINLVAVPMLATGVLMGVVAWLVEGGRSFRFDGRTVAMLLYLAVLGSAFTFTVHYWLLERIAATRLSVITLAIPVVAVLVGTVFLGEPLTLRTGAGALLVLSGVGIAAGRSRRTAS